MDFEKKHQEDLQRLRGFRLLDDDFMTKVFEDISCAELLLRIILNDEGIRVLEAHSQRGIKNLQGRSVRLDILAVDEADRVYNIEVQRSDKGAGVKRARYNSSLIDANVTEPGDTRAGLSSMASRRGASGSQTVGPVAISALGDNDILCDQFIQIIPCA